MSTGVIDFCKVIVSIGVLFYSREISCRSLSIGDCSLDSPAAARARDGHSRMGQQQACIAACPVKLLIRAGGPPCSELMHRQLRLQNMEAAVRAYICYRGFIRKGARVRIITFRDTTRMQSKSNRCI
jgi:hypothetical protein